MRRTVLLLAGVLLSVVALGSDSPKEYDDKVKVDELEGTWAAVAVGTCDDLDTIDHTWTQTWRAGKWTTSNGGGDGTYTIDSTRLPAQLDETLVGKVSGKRTWKYIYRIDGDTLETAFNHDGVRPSGFDKKAIIVIYKRVKK